MIRKCSANDVDVIFEIINDAAIAYKGIIPADRWHEPYMPKYHLLGEIEDGVEFWGLEERGILIGVMGIQDRRDVTLIRHAYVRTAKRNMGTGALLLRHLETLSDKPILIGTWTAASWAIAFYEKHGYRQVSTAEKNRLLKKYWNIPDRQVETSVVLQNTKGT